VEGALGDSKRDIRDSLYLMVLERGLNEKDLPRSKQRFPMRVDTLILSSLGLSIKGRRGVRRFKEGEDSCKDQN